MNLYLLDFARFSRRLLTSNQMKFLLDNYTFQAAMLEIHIFIIGKGKQTQGETLYCGPATIDPP